MHVKLKSVYNSVLVSLTCILSTVGFAAAEPLPSQAKMWEIIQEQQKQIKELSKQLKNNQEQTEAVTEVLETQVSKKSSEDSTPGWWQNTQLGGYGELHYNGGEKDEIDFHRFVLTVSHQFSESVRLFTEIELEHSVAGDDQAGEVELEQAYVELDVNEEHRAKAGVFLVPAGMLNERHEPTRFFGVERNPVEVNIIPSTWWEAGVGASGDLPADLRYDIAFHSGLKTPVEGSKAFKIRDGRQKVAKASAKDGALTARLRWIGVSGVEIGATGQYQNDITQSSSSEDVSAVLLAAHADIRQGPLGLKALYAHWNLDGEAPKAFGRDEQDGWFVEPGYYFDTEIGEVGIFGRYSIYDNESGDSMDSEYQQIDFGINYWPHQNVVLKADMALIDAPQGKTDDDILNLGVGFTF